MTTVRIELPESLASELASTDISRQHLNAFLVGAIEVWLRRQRTVAGTSNPWTGTFQDSAVDFVESLVEDNRALFDELAQK